MIFTKLMRLALAAGLAAAAVNGQQGHWAAASDETAKSIIGMERRWAEAACTHSGVAGTILAEDFQGTSPDGKRYSKAEAVESDRISKTEARDCRLIDAKVRLFGDGIALAYGSESSIRKKSDGTEYTRCLVWTDTWLRRNESWRIVAAQDMESNCK